MQLTSISRINLFLKNTKKKFSKSVYVIWTSKYCLEEIALRYKAASCTTSFKR